jgi:hypothetical protein
MDLTEIPAGHMARHPWKLARVAWLLRLIERSKGARIGDVGAGDLFCARRLRERTPAAVFAVDTRYAASAEIDGIRLRLVPGRAPETPAETSRGRLNELLRGLEVESAQPFHFFRSRFLVRCAQILLSTLGCHGSGAGISAWRFSERHPTTRCVLPILRNVLRSTDGVLRAV